jgi:lipid-A-disaccharide synthase
LFFLAGEASGDFQAAALLSALRRQRPATTCAAVGGPKLKAAGARIFIDSSEWGSIGPLSALPAIPSFYLALRRLVARIEKLQPRLLIAVDFGAFNLRVLRRLRACGYRGSMLYYFPPGAWLDDARQAHAVAATATAVTPFAHQRDFFHSLGLHAEYFGHPLASLVPANGAQPGASDAPRIVIAPGSRRDEVARHLAVLAQASRELERSHGARFTIVAASVKRAQQICGAWDRASGARSAQVVQAPLVQTLAQAQLVWSASGTAVLETALAGVPQIAFYVVSALQFRIALRRLPERVRHSITLPNLVLGRQIVPELVQHDFTPERLVSLSRHLLSAEPARRAQRDGYRELRAALGPPDALQRIAFFVGQRLEAEAGI